MEILLALIFFGFSTGSASHPPVGNPYEGCCGFQPNTAVVGGASVFVPNVFTPNGDGVNDLFLPFTGKDISKVSGFTITNLNADSILYQVADFQLTTGSVGWDGRVAPDKMHKGPFKYQMIVYSKSGESQMIEGNACSVLCDVESQILKDNLGCLYPIQANSDGLFDAASPSFESKRCFKN